MHRAATSFCCWLLLLAVPGTGAGAGTNRTNLADADAGRKQQQAVQHLGHLSGPALRIPLVPSACVVQLVQLQQQASSSGLRAASSRRGRTGTASGQGSTAEAMDGWMMEPACEENRGSGESPAVRIWGARVPAVAGAPSHIGPLRSFPAALARLNFFIAPFWPALWRPTLGCQIQGSFPSPKTDRPTWVLNSPSAVASSRRSLAWWQRLDRRQGHGGLTRGETQAAN